MSRTKNKTWDVVIYEMATSKVVSIAGTDLRESGSFHTADKRMETVLSRINLDHYSAAKVPPGKYKVDDILSEVDRSGRAEEELEAK